MEYVRFALAFFFIISVNGDTMWAYFELMLVTCLETHCLQFRFCRSPTKCDSFRSYAF